MLIQIFQFDPDKKNASPSTFFIYFHRIISSSTFFFSQQSVGYVLKHQSFSCFLIFLLLGCNESRLVPKYF